MGVYSEVYSEVYSGQGTSAYRLLCRPPGKEEDHAHVHTRGHVHVYMHVGALCRGVTRNVVRKIPHQNQGREYWPFKHHRDGCEVEVLVSQTFLKEKCQCQEKGREIFSLSLFFCDTRATSFIHLLDRRLQECRRREAVPRQ